MIVAFALVGLIFGLLNAYRRWTTKPPPSGTGNPMLDAPRFLLLALMLAMIGIGLPLRGDMIGLVALAGVPVFVMLALREARRGNL